VRKWNDLSSFIVIQVEDDDLFSGTYHDEIGIRDEFDSIKRISVLEHIIFETKKNTMAQKTCLNVELELSQTHMRPFSLVAAKYFESWLQAQYCGCP
jgi:hypothetical protein